MAGTELARAQQVLADYRQQGKAYVTDVRHQIWISQATETQAAVVDQYTAAWLLVDPDTKEPVNTDSSPNVTQETVTYLLDKSSGTWKVADEQGEDS